MIAKSQVTMGSCIKPTYILGDSYKCQQEKTVRKEANMDSVATTAFDNLDVERTGSIPATKESIADAIRLAGLNPTRHDLKLLLETSELGERLTKEAFLGMMARLEWHTLEDMQNTLLQDFAMFVDKDKDEYISEEMMLNILTKEGTEKLSSEEARKIVDMFEKDAQGDISRNELIDQLLAITPRV